MFALTIGGEQLSGRFGLTVASASAVYAFGETIQGNLNVNVVPSGTRLKLPEVRSKGERITVVVFEEHAFLSEEKTDPLR